VSICGSTTRVVRKTAAASPRSIANSWAISVPGRIRVSASFVVFPSLIVNYAGQAAVDSAIWHRQARRELASLGTIGRPWCARSRLDIGAFGLRTLVMQSSTASIVTLSAYHAGSVGVDQGGAPIIGQNIGTATSSAMAAIGASTTDKKRAVAYILFKVIAALIALVSFPAVIRLLVRAETPLTAWRCWLLTRRRTNVVVVLVLMSVIG
jgi:phosphate:Na+ symporter